MAAKEVSPKQIDRLPVWAQTYIRDLERERDLAIRELKDMINDQTPSSVYYDDTVTVEGPPWLNIRRYVQTHKVIMEYGGVCVQLSCDSYRPEGQRSGRIKVDYWPSEDKVRGVVVMQPTSYRAFEVCLPEKA
jgi:hypothetical protein